MVKVLFIIISLIHGLIHLIGFVSAFKLVNVEELASSISKFEGLIWLLVSGSFIAYVTLMMLGEDQWYFVAIGTVGVSQLLIFLNWKDSRFGTIANLMIAFYLLSIYLDWV